MEKNKSLTQSMFDRMKEGGFDTGLNLKCEFSFYYKKEKNLKKFYEVLSSENYVFEYLEQETKKKCHLYITQVRTFSVDSLEERNDYLNTVANRYEVEYDGWDVERI